MNCIIFGHIFIHNLNNHFFLFRVFEIHVLFICKLFTWSYLCSSCCSGYLPNNIHLWITNNICRLLNIHFYLANYQLFTGNILRFGIYENVANMNIICICQFNCIFTIHKLIDQDLSTSFESVFGHLLIEGCENYFILCLFYVKCLLDI